MKKILMILILGLILLNGCELPEIRTSCPNYIVENIPETFIVSQRLPTTFIHQLNLKTKWKDGNDITPISDVSVFMKCRGAQKGENINYVYCDDIRYTKTFISEKDIVGDTVSHKINLILDINPVSIEGKKYVDERITYKIVDYKCSRL